MTLTTRKASKLNVSICYIKYQVMNYKGLQLIKQPKLQSDDVNWRNLTLQLHGKDNTHWWELLENCGDRFYGNILAHLPYADCKKNIVLYTFNEKLYSETWTLFIGRG